MIEILLRVSVQAGQTRDLSVTYATDHTVADVAKAVTVHLGIPPYDEASPRILCARLDSQPEPLTPMNESGLLSGDVVEVSYQPGYGAPAQAQRPVSGLTCDVVSGAGTGRTLPLHSGRYLVGRDPRADLSLADPTVSGQHAVITVSSAGSVTIEPAGQVTNPVIVNGAPIDTGVMIGDGAVVQLGGCALAIRQVSATHSAVHDQLGHVPFNRTPYRQPRLAEVEVEGPGRAPTKPNRRNFNLLTVLLPMAGAGLFAFILGRPEFLLFALLGPLSAVANTISERRSGGRSYREELELFTQRRQAWVERLDAALADERRRRDSAAPDIADLARRAAARSPDLWPRPRLVEDFLRLRVGIGSDAALTTTKLPEAGEGDTLTTDLVEDLRARATLNSVPVVVDAVPQAVVALHGDPRVVAGATAALLAQAVTLHSPEDLVVCAAATTTAGLLDAVKWLPHTRSTGSPLDGEHVVVGTDAANDLLRRILVLGSERSEESWPRLLLLLEEALDVDGPTLSSLLEDAPAMGLTVVWIGSSFGLVPRQAMAIVDCPPAESGRRARLWFTDPAIDNREVDPDLLDLEAIGRVGRALAPVRDASGASTTNAIPRVAPLLDTLGTASAGVDWTVQRWTAAHGYSLRAPIGIGPNGPLEIDLVEHGPHSLIAGTSGAGKSELLQSTIAALITQYPPTRLNLLFIDYKGGASSNLFQDTPHTVGYVTNLEADLAMRALVSLRAELDRRMRVMEGRAKDLEEMLERFGDEAPASLVIVVDEFATLVKEIPDFVTGMVDIAQRGRSLGIHLILATQRPTGAVNDNILANTNLRISLRVLDPADSSSILGSAEAASIPGPLRGRGFARLGAGGLVEFQASFSGAPFTAEAGVAPVAVEDFPSSGVVTLDPQPAAATEEAPTHLDVVIDGVVGAARQLGLARGRRPWLEDLPTLLPLRDVLEGSYGPVGDRVPGRDVVLGVVDEPHRQRQRPEVVNLEATGGLLIFGTGGSGRTSTLRTLVASAVDGVGPEQVEVYVLDYAGRSLEGLRGLPHVAAVASADDPEQTTRILMHLRQQIAQRQEMLATHRAENLSAMQRQGGPAMARLLLVVDGYEAFERTFERGDLYPWSELLVETVLVGRSVGVHLLATADRRISVPAALHNAVSSRVILRTADADGLIDLGIPSATARDARLGDGRALLGSALTVQVALVGDDPGNAGQSAALEDWSTASAGGRTARLPELPLDVPVEQVTASLAASPAGTSFVVGLADLTLEPVVCDVRMQHLAVIGPAESGRSTALAAAARQLQSAGSDLWVITEASSPLAAAGFPQLATSRDDAAGLIESLTQLVAGGASSPPPVLVIDTAETVGDEVGYALDNLLRLGEVRVLAAFDGQTLSGYVSGWMAGFKASRRMLLLQPDDLGDLSMITPVRVRLRPGQSFPPGRGVFINNRHASLVQVAR